MGWTPILFKDLWLQCSPSEMILSALQISVFKEGRERCWRFSNLDAGDQNQRKYPRHLDLFASFFLYLPWYAVISWTTPSLPGVVWFFSGLCSILQAQWKPGSSRSEFWCQVLAQSVFQLLVPLTPVHWESHMCLTPHSHSLPALSLLPNQC